MRDHADDAVCDSVGWVVRKTDLYLTISPDQWVSPHDSLKGTVGSPTSIPWSMVLEWRYVEG